MSDATVDHVWPKCMGGAAAWRSSWPGLRLSHKWCNEEKGDDEPWMYLLEYWERKWGVDNE